jgi:phospholipid/cholesterol/gamma-HCH transport system substrate-binding protein
MKSRLAAVLSGVCVFALLAAGAWYTFKPGAVLRVSADFTAADQVYPGNRVAILGVPVGTVESVTPLGSVVRVTMTLPGDTRIPDSAQAYIMSPQVVSDRFVELSPPYRTGGELRDGAVIPVERTHAPIKWDQLVGAMDTLATALGPNGANKDGDLTALLHSAAVTAQGNGPALRDAVAKISQATGLLAGDTGDLGTVLGNVDRLGTDLSTERDGISRTIGDLSAVLSEVDKLVRAHGGALSEDLTNLANLTGMVAAHQQNLAETLDVLPLAMGNTARAVSPDERLRLRMDMSTNLSQFPASAALCQRLPVPLCSGPGLVNPIPLPPSGLPLGGG